MDNTHSQATEVTSGLADTTRARITACALFFATAAFVLWQNAHVAMLWDLSYLLDSSYRMAIGQVPYRDFPFAHPPLTFLLQALSIHLLGRVYWHVIVYAALSGAIANLLTWRILLRLLPADVSHSRTIAALLTLPLIVLGITSIYPHPVYDNDCILAILFALFCLQRISAAAPIRNLLTGAALTPPLFFKQNIGLLFLAAALGILALLAIVKRLHREPIRAEILTLLGAFVTLSLAILTIHLTAGLHHYLYWTITFAAQKRLPSFASMLGVYREPQLLWSLPAAAAGLFLLHRPARWAQFTALACFAAPFLFTLASLLWLDDPSDRTDQLLTLWPHILLLSIVLLADDLRRRRFTLTTLFPVMLLATIHGTFLSQQLWGSNYAIWPLLLLLIACLLPRIPAVASPLTTIIALTLCVNGSLYALSHERLSYSQLTGVPTRSTLPTLRGLITPGPWLPAFDELVHDTQKHIPQADTLLLFPGQDPFYYATGRIPRFPVLLFDIATNPYSPAQLAQAVSRQNVRWLIVNRQLQLSAPPLPNENEYLQALAPLFTLDHRLTNYDIYRRR
jgi:hypothetical protein